MAPSYVMNFDTRQLPQDEYEYVVIGSGIAGLYTAYAASRSGARVVLLTKHAADDSNTDKAQGGIAAALSTSDSPELHLEDTLSAGAGLCDREAVSILVNEGPDRVRDLIEMGANFDRKDGKFALTREGAHSRRRILHASGDATGAEIQRALTERVRGDGNIRVLENHLAVDLLVKENVCHGVLAMNCRNNDLKVFWGKAVILATGGLGQLYEHSTNPDVATGDGIAIAYRAGAEVMDMEFIQFHPTVLYLPGAPRFLISEAVRGEGAYLRNRYGDRFMPRYHPLAELAPRDIVVRAILSEMDTTASQRVFLDLSHLPVDLINERFPTIMKTCASYGLDITSEPIPVAPFAHYMMGGVKTNLNGETSINGLYACGETACLGVHGANRLASNSLLDGLVFGGRIVEWVKKRNIDFRDNKCYFINEQLLPQSSESEIDYTTVRKDIKVLMSQYAGPVRTAQGLLKALGTLEGMGYINRYNAVSPFEIEVKNMLEVGHLVAEAALMRTESRGGHYRMDFPQPVERWLKHVIIRR
ncbi:L-aspartate oxidase [Desulfocucumis palustris]|nr:L-aspartate oxidase [Desulfocucumis palustris]